MREVRNSEQQEVLRPIGRFILHYIQMCLVNGLLSIGV